ncbi:MAG TPA: T9SS type A sorting domain-containing protein [Chitinophagaceae bacterium]|nr:T9SS type A sorting domain-containing protein [Chitinophagaceae bacterium]
MKTFTLNLWRRYSPQSIILLAFLVVSAGNVFAQPQVTLSPNTLQTINVGGTVNFTATRNSNSSFWPGGNSNFTYTWSSTGPAVVGFTNNPGSGGSSSATVATFTVAGSYTVSCFVQEGGGGLSATSPATSVNVVVPAPANLWATSTNGTQVSSFTVSSGSYISGPDNIFVPSGGSTAALGKNPTGGPGGDNFYWLPNSSNNNGTISIWASTAVGGSQSNVNTTFDVNAGSNNDLGFVRLAMDQAKTGWILAGDGSTVYMAKFASNGTGSVSPVSVPVSLSGGVAATFQNGDVCIDGNNNMYALANNGSGLTQIFVGSLANPTVTLTQKWNLVAPGGANFSGTVNGVAFDILGSLYISTSTGLYFIDQTTVNTQGAGTVVCSLVRTQSGLQDLASNFFPTQTQLPVDLISFSGILKNNITSLSWETENEQNFDHFEIERRGDNSGAYAKIGVKASLASTGRSSYHFDDNLAGTNGTAFNYRLKIVDIDGRFKYSNIILVRRDQNIFAGIKLSPNPVVGGIATARFEASENSNVVFRVMDMNGKTMLQQTNKVYEGINSVAINNLDRLQPGMYLLQLENGTTVQNIKFSVAR